MLQVLFIRGDKGLDSRTAGIEPPTKHFVSTGYTLIGALLEMTAIVLMRTSTCVCPVRVFSTVKKEVRFHWL